MSRASEDLVQAHLAVIVEIVEVEADVGKDTTAHASLGDHHVNRPVRRNPGRQRQLWNVLASTVGIGAVADKQAVQDVSHIFPVIVDKLPQPKGIVAKGQVNGGTHIAFERHAERPEDGEELAVVEAKFQGRHVVGHQVHVLAEEEAEQGGGIFDKGQAEAATGGILDGVQRLILRQILALFEDARQPRLADPSCPARRCCPGQSCRS